MRVLVVTAVAEEAEAVLGGLTLHDDAAPPVRHPVGPYRDAWLAETAHATVCVLVGGVGTAAAAAATATALAERYDLVLDAGIAGGFTPGARTDSVVLADRVVAADLGAETGGPADDGHAGFVPLDAMGFGPVAHALDAALVARAADVLRDACDDVVVGTVLTVSTVTGSPASTARLISRHPGAVAEAMEGFGVVTAALPHGGPVLEVRTISNPIGVSDREQWDIPGALTGLADACSALVGGLPALVGTTTPPVTP